MGEEVRATVEISISLISLNQRGDLERLIPSLLRAARLARAEILLVDNASTDGTHEFIAREYPEVDTLHNPGRAGYGENHNLNLARARAEYFVIMNSDMVIPEPDLFVRLREYLVRHPDVGIVAPRILNEDGTIQGLNKRYPTLVDLVLRRFVPRQVQRLFQRRMDYYEMRDVGYDAEYDVEFMSGAFMFCRTELLRAVGGFDPGYFMYFEDVDLCRRVQASHRTVYYPRVSIIHRWERSSHNRFTYTSYHLRSGLRYFRKWGFRLA